MMLTAVNEDVATANVKLYDSGVGHNISSAIQVSVANMMRSPHPAINIRFMNCDVHTNGNDCGIYAIANAVQIAFGGKPEEVSYTTEKMRPRLRQCLEKRRFSPFPSKPSDRSKAELFKYQIKLLCSCRLPEH